ncbi:unnamed protein product [Anisakis simplex]|uniref:Uncharacterized protein n=1 Tax=Anisakis simplex TaxID=6269 RepID=A0A0M3JN28_ANISI|nr:unnamed protein product [Anisakis simplex]
MDVTESYGIRSENVKQMSFANEVDETLPVLDSIPIQTTSVHESASAKLRPPTRLVPVQLPIQKASILLFPDYFQSVHIFFIFHFFVAENS